MEVSFPTTGPITLTREVVATDGPRSSRAYESITATFEASSGTVAADFGIELSGPCCQSSQIGSHDLWYYSFVPDSNSTLNFSYDLTGDGYVRFHAGSFSERMQGTGSYSFELYANSLYWFAIGVDGVNCSGSCGGIVSSGSGSFQWAIVPEPETGLLVLAGLLGLAGWRRARE